MEAKKSKTSSSTITRNITQFDVETNNVYESVAIIAKRANQLSAELKEELNNKLAEFASNTDNLEEIFENREQIEISKHYERQPKPHLVAIQEFLDGEVYYRNPAKEAEGK